MHLFKLWVFSEYMPRSRIVGSYDSFIPSLLKGISILFSRVSVLIYILTNSARGIPFSHTLSIIYCFLDILMMSILAGVMWYFIVVLICISPIMSNVEHLFMCLLPTVCLWRNVLLRFPSIFWLIVFLVLSFMSCSYILETNPLSIDPFAIIFSHSEGCLSYLWFLLLCKRF